MSTKMKMCKVLKKFFIVLPLLICTSLFLEEALIGFWYKFVGLPLFETIDSTIFFDFVSIGSLLFFILMCFLLAHHIPRRLYILFVVYTIIYLEFRFLGSNVYYLVPFYIPALHWAAYADIVPIAMAFYIITTIKNRTVKNQNRSVSKPLYFEDKTNVEDLLGHKNQAETIAAILKTEYALSENSVGIAITGEWGAGKSTFLFYLNDALKDCICINFDPWIESSTDVVSDLLDRIEQGISQKDARLGRTFRRYVEKVNVTNVTGWFGLVILAIRNFFDYETEAERRTKFKTALKNQKTPIVVFIDDSDRLPNDLFLKTVSIIRGIGDFPNIVFIVAFDQQRANDKLKDFGGQDFMCKLFNVIHPLQPIDEKVIEDELVENISAIITVSSQNSESFKAIVHEAFSDISIKLYLPTLREMKRFCNIVEKDYCIIKNTEILHFIDIRQWLKVELLKFTDISVYFMIAANPKLYLKKETLFGLNTPYYVLKDDAMFARKESKELLDTLFHHQLGQQNDTYLINNPCYFDIYFSDKFPENYIKSRTIYEFAILKGDSAEVRFCKAERLKVFIHDNWSTYNDTNIESSVCEILKTYPVDLLYPVLEIIVKEYIANRKGTTFKELAERDNYRRYANVIRAHPYLSVLSFRKLEEFCEFDGQEAADDACILKSENPLIHCAIFNNQIRNWEHDGRICSDGYLFDLLKRLVLDGEHRDIIWAVSDCVSADLQQSFLNEYIKKYLLDFLPYLLCQKEDYKTGEILIYADIKAFEALFLSYKVSRRLLRTSNGIKRMMKNYSTSYLDSLN